MSNLPFSLALVVALIAVLGCQPSSESDDSRRAQRRFLSIGTAPPGGAFFPIGGALSEVLNAHSGEASWQFTAEATKGTKENIRRLVAGDLDLALANAAITYFAVRGEASWDEPHEVRTVMTLAPNVAMFLTAQGSGIRSIADLAGHRVTVGPAGAGFEDFLGPILQAHGASFDQFTPLNAIQSTAVGMLADGSADAAYLGGVIPTASVTQASSAQEIFFVPYEEEALDALTSSYPFFRRFTIPAGTYRGMDTDFPGMVVGALHLIASAAADEEMVYRVTRTLYESRQQVIERHAVGRAITPENVVRETGTEFHPGAVRFYREAGIWPDD
ncbi:MAG: TAXI family TRAP transporter solute-binding subunit [Deltaproteobacteria bacterium]|nr:TAXI family TRAP transporter solute-binding subunit [Deltaproteobacteria bacterium]